MYFNACWDKFNVYCTKVRGFAIEVLYYSIFKFTLSVGQFNTPLSFNLINWDFILGLIFNMPHFVLLLFDITGTCIMTYFKFLNKSSLFRNSTSYPIRDGEDVLQGVTRAHPDLQHVPRLHEHQQDRTGISSQGSVRTGSQTATC